MPSGFSLNGAAAASKPKEVSAAASGCTATTSAASSRPAWNSSASPLRRSARLDSAPQIRTMLRNNAGMRAKSAGVPLVRAARMSRISRKRSPWAEKAGPRLKVRLSSAARQCGCSRSRLSSARYIWLRMSGYLALSNCSMATSHGTTMSERLRTSALARATLPSRFGATVLKPIVALRRWKSVPPSRVRHCSVKPASVW